MTSPRTTTHRRGVLVLSITVVLLSAGIGLVFVFGGAAIEGQAGIEAITPASEPDVTTFTFEDQENDAEAHIDAFESNQTTVIEIRNEDGDVLGETPELASDVLHENISVSLDPILEETQELTAVPISVEGDEYEEYNESAWRTALFEVSEGSELALDNLDPVESEFNLRVDENWTVSAEATNTGTESDSFPIALELNGSEADATIIELDVGAQETVSFTLDDVDPGEYSVQIVGSETTTETGTLVAGVGNFQLSNLDPESTTVTVGEGFSVAVDVVNDGNVTETQSLDLSIRDDAGNSTDTQTQELTLAAGDTETITFENISTDGLAPGDYEYAVTSDDDETSGDLTVSEGASFQLSNLDPETTTIDVGETVNISVDVENDGNATGTQDIDLTVVDDAGNITTSESQELSLDAGETQTVTFQDVPTDDLDPGEYEHIVESDDDMVSGDITVSGDPVFQLSNLDPETATIAAGEEFTVSVDVENEGTATGTADITLRIVDEAGNSSLSETQNVSLDGGEATTVTFENVSTDALDPGEYEYVVESEDDELRGDLTVTEPATFAVSNLDPATVTVDIGERFDVAADIENTGTTPETQEIIVTVLDDDGEAAYTRSDDISLNANEFVTVLFEDIPTDDLAPGTYEYSIESADDSATGELTIRGEATFELSNLDPMTVSVVIGEHFDVAADVENIGDADGTQAIELTVHNNAGSAVFSDSYELALDAGEEGTVFFDVIPTDDLEPGDYEYTVTSIDDELQGSLTVSGEPSFQLSTLDPGEMTVPIGDSFAVAAEVENVGTAAGTQAIDLTIVNDAGETILSDTQDVSLDVGDLQVVTFENIPTDEFDPGDYEYVVSFDDAELRGDLTVTGEATFELSNLDPVDITAEIGEVVTVSVDVENTGTAVGTKEITLTIRENPVVYSDSQSVTLEAGEVQTVSFDVPTADLAEGHYTVSIESDEVSVTGSIEATPEESTNLLLLAGVAALIGLIGLIALVGLAGATGRLPRNPFATGGEAAATTTAACDDAPADCGCTGTISFDDADESVQLGDNVDDAPTVGLYDELALRIDHIDCLEGGRDVDDCEWGVTLPTRPRLSDAQWTATEVRSDVAGDGGVDGEPGSPSGDAHGADPGEDVNDVDDSDLFADGKGGTHGNLALTMNDHLLEITPPTQWSGDLTEQWMVDVSASTVVNCACSDSDGESKSERQLMECKGTILVNGVDCDALQEKIPTLEKQIDGKETARDTLDDQIAALEKEKKAIEEEIDEKLASIDGKRDAVASHKDEIAGIHTEIEEVTDDAEAEKARKEEDLEDLRDELRALYQDYAEVKTEYEVLSDMWDGMWDLLADDHDEMGAESVYPWEEDFEEAFGEDEVLSQELDLDMGAVIASAGSNGDNESLGSEGETLAETVEEAIGTVNLVLVNELRDAAVDNVLETHPHDVAVDAATDLAERVEGGNALEDLAEPLREISNELGAINDRKRELEEEISEIDAELGQPISEPDHLQDDIGQHERQMDELNDEVDDLEAEIEALQTESVRLQETIEDKQALLDTVRDEIAERNAELEKRKSVVEEYC